VIVILSNVTFEEEILKANVPGQEITAVKKINEDYKSKK
jgi:hypothetical protein